MAGCKSSKTVMVLADPLNDFLSDGGKVWPRVEEAAESAGLHQHLDAAGS